MRIAVVGSGIAGCTAAHKLSQAHEVTVFEASDRLGGHAHTIDVDLPEGRLPVDVGFIVFNRETYPTLCSLFAELGVRTQASDMSFSVSDPASGTEWSAQVPFARKRNALSWNHWRMLADWRRFKHEALSLLEGGPDESLEGWLNARGYSDIFIEGFLLPMGAAIWSADREAMRRFPARFFARFFFQHRFLDVGGQPQWRTVVGGSRQYLNALCHSFRSTLRLSHPVQRVIRHPNGVEVLVNGGSQRYDKLVFALHADQALGLLARPSPAEQEILGALPYVPNHAVLHTDTSFMPRRRRAWASWNYRVGPADRVGVDVTYDMTRLMRLPSKRPILLTLNPETEVAAGHILFERDFKHPLFTPEGTKAQARHGEINGRNHTYYCGAYWRYGFHEDGAWSGARVAESINR